MALTTTQAQIREAVQRAADVVAFTDRHPPASINHLINRGLGALSTLCRTTNPEFQPLASFVINFDGVSALWPLPVNFRSTISVEYASDDGHKTWLVPYEMHERPMLTDPDLTSTSLRAQFYRRIGDNIEFLPRPANLHNALIWYATTVTQLTDDGDTMDTMERLDTYVIWWAAREIAMERGDWERHDRLTGKLTDISGEIRILARSLDLSAPARPVDLRKADRSLRYTRGWRRR